MLRWLSRYSGLHGDQRDRRLSPAPYLLPAAGLRIAPDASSGLWIARVLAMVSGWLFIALGLVLLWNGTSWSLVGPLIALTPLVMYVSAVINPSDLEIASSFALTSCVFRISRDPARILVAYGPRLR